MASAKAAHVWSPTALSLVSLIEKPLVRNNKKSSRHSQVIECPMFLCQEHRVEEACARVPFETREEFRQGELYGAAGY